MEKIKFTKKQINFIIKNYPNKGLKECARLLKIDEKHIRNKVNNLGLKVSKERFSKQQSIKSLKTNYADIKLFLDLKNPKIIYFLGLMWADGYLHDTKDRFELSINKDDFKDVSDTIKSLGEWNVYERNRKNRTKTSITVGCYSKEICNLMRKYGFVEKSNKQPLFLNKIPKELIHYFFRGLIDGDGCFYISPNKKCRQFYLAGSYNQEWDYFTNFLKELNIKYKIKQKIQKKTQKYSVVFLSGRELVKLGEIIYKNFTNDKIGFTRKFNKFVIIKNSFL